MVGPRCVLIAWVLAILLWTGWRARCFVEVDGSGVCPAPDPAQQGRYTGQPTESPVAPIALRPPRIAELTRDGAVGLGGTSMDGPGTWSRIQRRGSQRPLWIGKTVFLGVPSMAINRSEGIATAAQSGSSADEVERLLGEMSVLPYVGPYLTMVSPTVWELHFTRPMLRLLELGPAVQSHLLPRLSDPRIKDQVMMVLGGVGDEQAVGPIIEAMIPAAKAKLIPDSERINTCANLALTNLTQADVVWDHRAGGTIFLLCPNTPRECWAKWWEQNKRTFRTKDIHELRDYGYYPHKSRYQTQ
ncbi:MAG TPA: hypothetical protein VN345_05425 [Blastocatellia bacterium]|nr:hypothetical protein [Blastocatellia bacterium]